MRHNQLITPEGTSDLLFSDCATRRAVEKSMCKLFACSGYSEVRTPELEFYDVFDLETDPIPQENMYKLTDRKGRLLVLRPDSTMPIARMVSTKLRGAKFPLRLYYNQPSFRINESMRGSSDQIGQVGIELIGAGGTRADLEVLRLAVSALSQCTQNFRLEIGHAGIFKTLVASLPIDERHREKLRRLIDSKNYAALSGELDSMEQTQTVKAIRQLPRLFGGVQVLDKARELVLCEDVNSQLDSIANIYNALSGMGYADKLIIDLGLVHQNDYYTGIVFSAYAEGSGAKILSGGRYDNLLAQFDFDMPACGFAVNIDYLVKAIGPSSYNTVAVSDVLVVAEDGKEPEALKHLSWLHSQKTPAEFCVLDNIGEATEYASERGIKRIDIVSESIKTITIPEDKR